MAKEVVRSAHVVITFDGQRCIHARNCVLSRPDVFVPNVEGEWIHPERATVGGVRELAHACPSGAIAFEPLDGSEPESAPIVNTVRVRENGPLAIHGPLTIAGEPAGFRATLCRCGASSKKPYCDGSHATVGFAASGEPAAAAELKTLAVRNGELAITPLDDGPLQVVGPLEVVSGTGRTTKRVEKAFLCRCGQSSNKPYCDGTHKTVGFKTT